MQQEFTLTTPDKFLIPCTLNYKQAKPNKVILLVHGFTGNQHEHQYFNAVEYFTNKGFAVCRFDFYARMPRVRKLAASSLASHISDLEVVLKYLKKQFKQIYLVGHSLGGMVAALADQSAVEKVVLWDPANGFASPEDLNATFNQQLQAYVVDLQMQIIVGKKLIAQWMKVTVPMQIKHLQKPTKIIFAAKYIRYAQWQPYFSELKVAHTIKNIAGASHRFTEEGVLQKLYRETYAWIK